MSTQKIRFKLVGLMFLLSVFFICGVFIVAFSPALTAEASTPPRYTMT